MVDTLAQSAEDIDVGLTAPHGQLTWVVDGYAAGRSTRDELSGSVTQHDDGGVGPAAGDGRQDRPVDHP